MKKTYSNHNHTLCHPEAPAEGSGHKSTMSSRFFTAFRMTVFSRLSSSCMPAVVFACLLLTTPTQAKWGDNCTLNGGTIIKANEYGNDKGGYCNDPNNADLTNNCNGMEFCMSKKAMNWWSAFTWCDSIGGKLASFEHVCPTVQPIENYTKGTCPNVKGIGSFFGWVNAGYGKNKALQAMFSSGGVAADYRTTTQYQGSPYVALCEE